MPEFLKKTDDPKQNALRAQLLVQIFVVLHGVVCLLTHNVRSGDGLYLTLLTIAMVYVLIRFYRIPFDVFLGIAFLSCLSGFYLGVEGARLMDALLPLWGVWNNVLMTMAVTELLGQVIILLFRKEWKTRRN